MSLLQPIDQGSHPTSAYFTLLQDNYTAGQLAPIFHFSIEKKLYNKNENQKQ